MSNSYGYGFVKSVPAFIYSSYTSTEPSGINSSSLILSFQASYNLEKAAEYSPLAYVDMR